VRRYTTADGSVAVVAAVVGAAGPPPAAFIPPVPGGEVSAGNLTRIVATVVTSAPAETLTMKWSATRAELGGGGGGDEAVDLLANNFIASSSITTRNLVLSPNVLAAGWKYTLRFDVDDENGAAAAFLSVQENQPPAGRPVQLHSIKIRVESAYGFSA